jgi:competence protein ComEC
MRRSTWSVVCIALVIFAVRYYSFIHDTGDPQVQEFINQNIEALGVVMSEPDERDTSTRFVINLREIIIDGQSVPVTQTTNLIASDQLYSRIQYGDLVRVKGVMNMPENFETDTGREFDYVTYLKKDKIFYQIKKAQLELIEHNHGNPIKRVLFAIKKSFIKNIDSVIPFPESGLASGVVVAGKKGLPEDVEAEFQKTGTLQIVVLSGYNVTIVAEMIMAISRTVSLRLSPILGVAGIMLFVIMAGGSATVVRGGVMAILIILAKQTRRRYSVSRALWFTAGAMLLYNPLMLLHDPSFQLSFLATAGLIYVSPIVEKHLKWIPERFKLREITTSTVAAQITVLPLLIYSTGVISIVSLPANILVTFAVPITMLMCFITGLLGYLSVFLAFPISLFAFVLLRYILQTIHIFSRFPFAEVHIPLLPAWMVSLVYMSYSVFLWRFYKNQIHETEIQKLTRNE